MKKVVIMGAFDRYNYGDNLMPILFELFLKRYYPDIHARYNWVYVALTTSDLTRYGAKKTQSIAEVFSGSADDIVSVISIGGEVLCASSSTLFTHMDHPKPLQALVLQLKKRRLGWLADFICRRFYRLPWEYPYIPKKLSPRWRTGFNSIGGGVSARSLGTYFHKVRSRLSEADYLSVRNSETRAQLLRFSTPELTPDSAITMAEFANDRMLEESCSRRIRGLLFENYLCFQAAPRKVGASARVCAEKLSALSEKYGLKVVLCPIGYANGHDDIQFLREVEREAPGKFEVLGGLTLWEIMFVVRHASVFIGTSLHGVVTCLSFGVPYIALNPSVKKVDNFLRDWGVFPSTHCVPVDQLDDVFEGALEMDRSALERKALELRRLGLENNHRLIRSLEL